MAKKVKTPSEHMRLDLLLEIQRNNCIGCNGEEYSESEVQELIWLKQSRLQEKVEKEFNKFSRRIEE